MSEREFPEIYADGVQAGVGPYGVSLTYFLSDPEQPGSPGAIVGRVRLSRDLARAMLQTIQMGIDQAPEGKVVMDEPRT